jgi:NAD(P)-dependent dehydrogenase (short-subunit alcohol dehydrogenase family)
MDSVDTRLDDDRRVAIVTGAARGIGDAVVRTLTERGIAVAAVDLRATELTELAEKLTADWTDPKRYLWLLGLVVPSLAFVAGGESAAGSSSTGFRARPSARSTVSTTARSISRRQASTTTTS